MIEWIKDKWIKLRLGYSAYFGFAFSMGSFMMTTLVVVKLYYPAFSLGWEFIVAFVLVTFPVCTILGDLHVKYQQDKDNKVRFKYVLERLDELKEMLRK